MQTQSKISISPDGGNLVLREGRAAELIEPVGFTIRGTIEAPAEWVNGYEAAKIQQHENQTVPLIDLRYCYAIIDKPKALICLTLNNSQENGRKKSEIIGQMKFSDKYTAFKINTGYRWGLKEMSNFLKFNRRYFNEPSVNMEIVAALRNFNATVEKSIQDSSDDRGNLHKGLQKRVTMTMPEAFQLTIPIFDNLDPLTINVELCIDESDGGVRCWLQSVDAEESIDHIVDEVLGGQAKLLQKLGVVVLYA